MVVCVVVYEGVCGIVCRRCVGCSVCRRCVWWFVKVCGVVCEVVCGSV